MFNGEFSIPGTSTEAQRVQNKPTENCQQSIKTLENEATIPEKKEIKNNSLENFDSANNTNKTSDEFINKSKRKRIRRKEKRDKKVNLRLFGNNVDGLFQKLESLEHLILTEKPSILFFQETKLCRSGRIKTPSSKQYTWYELHRTSSAEKEVKGGGLAIGVLSVLDPSWISEGDDNAEALTIEIWIEGFPIRLLCA